MRSNQATRQAAVLALVGGCTAVALAFGFSNCRGAVHKERRALSTVRTVLPGGYAYAVLAFARVRGQGEVDLDRSFVLGKEALLGEQLRDAYPELFKHIDELMFFCGDGSEHTIELDEGQDLTAEGSFLTGNQLNEMLQVCMDALSDELGTEVSVDNAEWGSLVDEAIEETEARLAECDDGFQGTIASGASSGSGPETDDFPRTFQPSQIRPQRMPGTFEPSRVRDYQDTRDWFDNRMPESSPRWSAGTSNGTVTYTRTNSDGGTTTFVCPTGGGTCGIIETPPPTPPDPPPEPPEDPPPSEPEPKPEPENFGQCIEFDCTSTCEELEEWWGRFKDMCEPSDWTTYECASFVAGMNGCPDPAIIRPSPDGDFVCSLPSDGQTLTELREQFCEFQGGIMHPGDPEGARICSIHQPIDSAYNICSDPRARPMGDQCALEFLIDVGIQPLPEPEPPHVDPDTRPPMDN